MDSPDPEGGVEGFPEGAVEGVEVEAFHGRRPGGKAVEGQFACRPVQEHSHSVTLRRLRYVRRRVSVPGGETQTRAENTPGLRVPSEAAVISIPSPPDPPVRRPDTHSSLPLHLPVTASSQTFCTQNLLPHDEPVGVIRVRLRLRHRHHGPAVVREEELPVGCVWVE